MHVWLLNPFHGGSHAQWALGYASASQHTIQLFSLPGRHWKWRMHGAALTLAQACLAASEVPDIILATDMMDLSTFAGLTRRRLGHVPLVLYMHENQLTYPWSSTDPDPNLKRDQHYGFINYQSALTADEVWFNSAYHQRSFLEALRIYLQRLPDHQETALVDEIARKCRVVPVGLDLKSLDTFAPQPDNRPHPIPNILWNHRWEYDKGPEVFFEALFKLQEVGFPFKLILLGERYRRSPTIFTEARERLADHLVQVGYVSERAEYSRWLWEADILPVSAKHDFFGISSVEAIYCGALPVLPDRLAYPEHVDAAYLYPGEMPLDQAIRHAWERRHISERETSAQVARYDWSIMAAIYDEGLENILDSTH